MGQAVLLWFGPLRDRLPAGRRELDLLPGDTVASLFARVFAGFPEAALPVAYALDAAYVPADTPVPAGAEVAVIPPVGGG